jgi:hypothetical protein
VRLCFDPGDDDGSSAVRDALLDELDGWLDRPAPERAAVVTDTKIFLDWRYHDSSGVLDEFTPSDVTEFLLEWCPRRFKGHPVAGHAALWLISRERADAATVAGFVDVAVLVDVLAGDVDDPERLCSFFASLSEPLRLSDDIWRHPAPETAVVLDALGVHLPDRELAKAARKAAIRHRSWMANRG